MSALTMLEQQLRQSVAAGAAAPAATVAIEPPPTRRPRSWRAPRLLVLAILLTGATTGALAATGLLRITHPPAAQVFPMRPDTGPGVASSPARILPLRVRDPHGGPEWVLRTFTTNRGAACVQAGQQYRGRFGLVQRDAAGERVFQLVGTTLGPTTACTNRRQGDLPVLRGRKWAAVDGGPSGCGRWLSRTRCTISAVTAIRFGLLGDAARTTTWTGDDGRRVRRGVPSRSGGAYLFAEAVDPRPYQASSRIEDEIERQVALRYPPGRRGVVREQSQYYAHLYKPHRAELQRLSDAMQRLGTVEATFSDGSTFVVAGPGASRAPLPGVRPTAGDLPADVTATVTARFHGLRRAIHISFRAPVALDRLGRAYHVYVKGPLAPRCAPRSRFSSEDFVVRQTSAGAKVRVAIAPPARDPQWCPRRDYDVIVRLIHGDRGSVPELLVGKARLRTG